MSLFDVFISYSSKDKTAADAVCAVLEQNRLRCWIAPRDIPPGAEWGASIMTGIQMCRVMVLIFSNHANCSRPVRCEVERAMNKNLIIVPFRIEESAPTESLELFLSGTHWLDAFTPPFQNHLEMLSSRILGIIGREPLEQQHSPDVTASSFRGHRRLAFAAVGALLVVVLVIALTGRKPEVQPSLTNVVTAFPPKVPQLSTSPLSNYKITIEGRVDPPHAVVLLAGKPLSSWGGEMPSDSAFPATLSVGAGGYVAFEDEVEAEPKERVVRVKLPNLSRSSGSLAYKLPLGGVDYSHLHLSWLHNLPGEEKASPPQFPSSFELPQDINSTVVTSKEMPLPTGVYKVWIQGQDPIPDSTFDLPIEIHPNDKVQFDKIPTTIAGKYTYEFPLEKDQIKIIVRRVIMINKNPFRGVMTDAFISGPERLPWMPKEKVIYPFMPTEFKLGGLKFDQETGLKGFVLKQSATMHDEEFTINQGWITAYLKIPGVDPINAEVRHEVPTGPSQ